MDQCAFVFATRGQCIKGKQCQLITIKNQIFVFFNPTKNGWISKELLRLVVYMATTTRVDVLYKQSSQVDLSQALLVIRFVISLSLGELINRNVKVSRHFFLSVD